MARLYVIRELRIGLVAGWLPGTAMRCVPVPSVERERNRADWASTSGRRQRGELGRLVQ